jgi:hypothetical protein
VYAAAGWRSSGMFPIPIPYFAYSLFEGTTHIMNAR